MGQVADLGERQGTGKGQHMGGAFLMFLKIRLHGHDLPHVGERDPIGQEQKGPIRERKRINFILLPHAGARAEP